MVTIDPTRDSAAGLGQYLAGFDARFEGVIPDADGLRRAQQAYGVTVAMREPHAAAPPGQYYTLDHTSGYFLIDRRGRLRVRETADAPADAIAGDIERLLAGD
jgi:protein SCO1/2